jgi:AAA domain
MNDATTQPTTQVTTPKPAVQEAPRAVTVAAGTPPFRMSPRRSFSDRWLKLLVYGPYGVGKTTLAGSSVDVESMRDVLMIDAESGDLVMEENPRIQMADEIEHVRVTNFLQVARVQEFLKAHCVRRDSNDLDGMRKVEAALKGISPDQIQTPRKFRTVIIDSLSEVEQYCMYGLLKVNEGELLTGSSDEIDVARFDEFRKNNMMIQVLVRAFRDLPMHVIFVCSQAYTQDELKRFHYGPRMTGQLSSQIQGFTDVVGYLRAGTPDDQGHQPRRLFVQPIERFDAKNRRASFRDSHLEDPTMASLMTAFGLVK